MNPARVTRRRSAAQRSLGHFSLGGGATPRSPGKYSLGRLRGTAEGATVAKLDAAARKKLPKSEFGVPSKAPGPGSYPMPDKAHAANAKARAAGKPVEAAVDRKANKILHRSADGSIVSGADAEEAEMAREKAAKGEDSPAAKVYKAQSGAMIRAGLEKMRNSPPNPEYNRKMHKMADGGTVKEDDFGKKLKDIPRDALKKVTDIPGKVAGAAEDAASGAADAAKAAPGKALKLGKKIATAKIRI